MRMFVSTVVLTGLLEFRWMPGFCQRSTEQQWYVLYYVGDGDTIASTTCRFAWRTMKIKRYSSADNNEQTSNRARPRTNLQNVKRHGITRLRHEVFKEMRNANRKSENANRNDLCFVV